MPRIRPALLLTLLLALLPAPSLLAAADDVRVKGLVMGEDPSGQLGPAEVAAGAIPLSPLPLAKDRHRLGTSDSAFWLKLEVTNDRPEAVLRWLEVGQARLREVTYHERIDGRWVTRPGGRAIPLSERELPTLTQVFSVDIPAHASKELLVRVASDTPIVIHPQLHATAELLERERNATRLEYFMAGAVILMLLFGVVMWLMLREPGFLVFGLLSLAFLLFRWSIKGMAFREFWPESPDWTRPAIGLSLSLVGMLLLILHRILLRTRELFPRIDRVLIGLIFSFALIGVLFLFLPHRPMMHFLTLWGLSIALFSPVLGYMAWRKGVVLWGYAFAGYVLPWQVTKLLYFSSIGWLPRVPATFSEPAMAISVLLASVIVLSGLGARVVLERRERMRIKEEQRAELERLVDARTRELDTARQTAENALSEHRQFLAMISHELRSPIASIASACTVLEAQREQDTIPPARVLRRIRRAVSRMTGFMDNLMTEDRFESDAWRVRAENVASCAFLEEVVEQARQSVTRHELVLEVGDIPSEMTFDPALIRVALLNLIDNAAKVAPEGTQITVIAEPDDPDGVNLKVVDAGPGLQNAAPEKLFEKFTRGDNMSRIAGVGMGLYLVRRIARLHGGDANLMAGPDGGATASLTLPIKS
ncbi:sensor histidine kinase [Thioalkalivibrio sp. ALMg13-2]|uniref:sensor histidine kinase n=1 Tax=Thioalkalivibrio sp. ALMg13-2 TaxID=1158167 RepID=UPI00037FBD4A|nr:sensor histidine kinase [Thioalkalivibrio sp. ALMg13-2]